MPAEQLEYGEVVTPDAVCATTLKKVSINTHEYYWEISTLESLLRKWREECFGSGSNDRSVKLWLVALNDEIIPAARFSSVAVSDGDAVFIAMGALAGG